MTFDQPQEVPIKPSEKLIVDLADPQLASGGKDPKFDIAQATVDESFGTPSFLPETEIDISPQKEYDLRGFVGGGVRNELDRPIPVIANRELKFVSPGRTSETFEDIDAIVTDPAYQARWDGKQWLLPTEIPPDAQVVKISNTTAVEVNESKDGNVEIELIQALGGSPPRPARAGEFNGNRPVEAELIDE